MNYYSKPHIHSRNKIKVELDLSIYITKSGVKNVKGIDTLKL